VSVAAYLNSKALNSTTELDLRTELQRALNGRGEDVPKTEVAPRYLTPVEYDAVLRAHCRVSASSEENS
jgi:hypothetical protein